MEDNLFLQAMDPQEVVDINEVKLNKQFALRLISDLSKVFQTNHEVEDDKDFARIRMRNSPSWHNCFSFTANKSGVVFSSNILTYESKIGHLYKKYKDNYGTRKERENDNHCVFTIQIKIDRNDLSLNEKLKDIVELMNLKGYFKRF